MSPDNNLDLSHLLSEVSPPENGPALVRKAAARRHHRRQAVAGSLGAFVLLATGVGLAAGVDNAREVRTRSASHSETTTSTTAAPTTTAAPVDLRKRYVGVRHTLDLDVKLPHGAKLETAGEPVTDEAKKGDFAYTWAKDAHGDMLWLERIVAVANNNDGFPDFTYEVIAAFDLPERGKDEFVCLGWCSKDGKADRYVVGAMNTAGKVTQAWRVDFKQKTISSISSAGWVGLYDGPYEADLPQRPELYRLLATTSEDSIVSDIQFFEGVSINGRSAPGNGTETTFLVDNKEKKDVMVNQSNGRSSITVVEQREDGTFTTGNNPKYQGASNPNLMFYVVDSPTSNDPPVLVKAWLIDTTTAEAREVSVNDVTLG